MMVFNLIIFILVSKTMVFSFTLYTRSFAPIVYSSRLNKRHLSTLRRAAFDRHIVYGIECHEVVVDIKNVGLITILEATATSQEDLVDMALAIDDGESILNIPNKLKVGDPYGAVLWPAASALANHLAETHDGKNDITLLELGSGTGLVSLCASTLGISRVIATDYEVVPLKLLEFAQLHLNKGKTKIDTGTYSGMQ
jgi:Lysine methyltransferase